MMTGSKLKNIILSLGDYIVNIQKIRFRINALITGSILHIFTRVSIALDLTS